MPEEKYYLYNFVFLVIKLLSIYNFNYNEKTELWKIRPDLNTIIKDLFEINKNYLNDSNDLKNLIIDLQVCLDAELNANAFLEDYWDILAKL